jgi:hypothetical protein
MYFDIFWILGFLGGRATHRVRTVYKCSPQATLHGAAWRRWQHMLEEIKF